MKTGIELIAQERQEQIEKHGRTLEHDIKVNRFQQLRHAASALIDEDHDSYSAEETCPSGWDLSIWTKIYNKPLEKRLIIAATCLAAEYDRRMSGKHAF